MKDSVRSPSKSSKERKQSKKISAASTNTQEGMPPAEPWATTTASTAAAAAATATAAAAAGGGAGGGSNGLSSHDPVGLMGAEAYLLEDLEQIKQQRKTNDKIRALLSAAKGKRTREKNTSSSPSPTTAATAASTAAAAAAAATVATPAAAGAAGAAVSAAAAGVAAAAAAKADSEARPHSPAPARVEREAPPLPLPEFALLPELPECDSSEQPRPLRPWQLQQHQQLLLLQRRQLQQTVRKPKVDSSSLINADNGEGFNGDSEEDVCKEGDQPQLSRARKETAGAAAYRGAAAVAAAGAAAAAAGADFFGRLHAECVAALRLLRPTEEEERLKKKAAARVRAVCRSLWPGCFVEIFGSSFTALGLPGSDLDLCVFAEMDPPLHVHYACSRCLCCSNSSSNEGSSSAPNSSSSKHSRRKHVAANSPDSCGREAADTSCCCSKMGKKRKSGGSSSSSNRLCSSNCNHGGQQGLRDVLDVAEDHRDLDDSCFRRDAVSKIREFARCLRELNQAAAAAKRQGSNVAQRSGRFADSIEPVVSARVPICKFKDAETGVSVDVSFDQPSAVLTSLYVRHRLKEFALLQPLIILNKMLLRHWRLHEPFKGGVGSYLIFVMFNYETSSISVRGNGSLRSKSSRARSLGMWKPREDKPMLSAESPLDPSRDLGCSAFKIMQVRAAWRQAYLRLAARLLAEVRQPSEGSPTACSEDPLLSCVFGSDFWAEELGRHAPRESTESNSREALTATRPGLWISKTLAASEKESVEGLFRFSPHLRRWLDAAEETSSILSSPASASSSSDSESSEGVRRRPWERNQQQQQQQQQQQKKKDVLVLPPSKRPNTHVIFDSSESDSSTASATALPVRGFASSRSSSPSVLAMGRAGATKGASREPTPQTATTPSTAAGTAANSASAASPAVIDVEDSSSSGSSVEELRQQARREANRQKRKRRKQRQAAEARKRMRS
ncbi:hypothetical protein Emed_006454 [Eimeria media]